MTWREVWLAWDLIGWMNKSNSCLVGAQFLFKTIDPKTGQVFLKEQLIEPGDDLPVEPPREKTAAELKTDGIAGAASTQRFTNQMQIFLSWIDADQTKRDALDTGLNAFGTARTEIDNRIAEQGSIADTAISQANLAADSNATLIPIGEQIEANNVPWETALLPTSEAFRIVRVAAIVNDLLDFTSWFLRGIDPETGLPMSESIEGIRSRVRIKCGMISRFYYPNLQSSIPGAQVELEEIGIVPSELMTDVQNMAAVTDHVLTEAEELGTVAELATLGEYIEQEVTPLDLIRRSWRYS